MLQPCHNFERCLGNLYRHIRISTRLVPRWLREPALSLASLSAVALQRRALRRDGFRNFVTP